MKTFVKVVSIVIALSATAHAGQALESLLNHPAALKAAAIEIPAPQAVRDFPMPTKDNPGVLTVPPQQASALADAAREDGYVVLELDGRYMTDKASLFSQAAYGLGLPGVPENWDALNDYLNELPELHNNKQIMIVVRNAGAIRRADQALYDDFRDLAEFASKNVREWSRHTVRLRFVFEQ